MENVSTIIDRYSLLKKDGPIVETTINLNTAFFFVSNPITTTGDILPDYIQIEIFKYGKLDDGSPNYDEILDYRLEQFRETLFLNADNSSKIPYHNCYYGIENTYYKFIFTYVYIPTQQSDNVMNFYSKSTVVNIDNRIPTIYEGIITEYMYGKFRLYTEKSDIINIWIGIDPVEPDQGDIVYNGSQLLIIETPKPLKLSMADESYRNFGKFLMADEEFKKTIEIYFGENLPVNGNILFKFKYRNKNYFLNLIGALDKFIKGS